MKKLTRHADAKKKLNGHDPTVSGLYRIAGVNWLLAEEEQFSCTTTLRLVDLEGLPRDNTMGPLNTKSLTDARHQVRKRAQPNPIGNFLVENKPTTDIARCTDSLRSPRDSPRASIRGFTPRSAHWKVMRRYTRTWSHQREIACLQPLNLRKRSWGKS